MVVASDLTLIECERILIRSVATDRLTESAAADRKGILREAAGHWVLLGLDGETSERARRPFPREPIRTLDAIHLATAVVARSLVPGIALLSLDERIRASGRELGFRLLPDEKTSWSVHERKPRRKTRRL